MPSSLPTSCLTMAPRLDTLETYNRKPLSEMDMNHSPKIDELNNKNQPSPRKAIKQNGTIKDPQKVDNEIENGLKNLKEQLASVIKSKPGKEMSSSGTSMVHSTRECISRVYPIPVIQRPIQLFLRNSGTPFPLLPISFFLF